MTRTAAPPTRPPEPDGPRQVSKFEFNLLRILQFIVGRFPADSGMQLVRAAIARPECLSPDAVELVKDTRTMQPFPELGKAMKRTALQNGIVMRIDPSWFAVCPPLIADEPAIDEMCGLIEDRKRRTQ